MFNSLQIALCELCALSSQSSVNAIGAPGTALEGASFRVADYPGLVDKEKLRPLRRVAVDASYR